MEGLVREFFGLVRLVRTEYLLCRLRLGSLSPRKLVHKILHRLALRVECCGTPRRKIFGWLLRWRRLSLCAWVCACESVERRNEIKHGTAGRRWRALLVVLWGVHTDRSLAIMRIGSLWRKSVFIMV